MVKSSNCEEVVKIYMIPPGSGSGKSQRRIPSAHISTYVDKIFEYFENKYIIN